MSKHKANACEALPDLEKFGYSFKGSLWLYSVSSRRPILCYVIDTPDGERKVKVDARSHRNGGRYMHGITWPLLSKWTSLFFGAKMSPRFSSCRLLSSRQSGMHAGHRAQGRSGL
jgi:hypothetical protein